MRWDRRGKGVPFWYTEVMNPAESLSQAFFIGHVKNGVIVLDGQFPLSEGQAVRIEPLSQESNLEQVRK